MRRNFSASLPPLLLALSACNADRTAPQVALPPPSETIVRVTPGATEGGCAAEIARYKGIVDHDAATGNVAQSVQAQIQGEIGDAQRACDAGDQLRARYLLRASKERHGYPQG